METDDKFYEGRNDGVMVDDGVRRKEKFDGDGKNGVQETEDDWNLKDGEVIVDSDYDMYGVD